MNWWLAWANRTAGTDRLPLGSLRAVSPRSCDQCGAKLFPGDWLTRDGCCYCDAGLDLLTPWGQT